MSQHCSPGLAAALIADTSARGELEWLGLIACHGSGREGFSASLQNQGLLLSHPHVRVMWIACKTHNLWRRTTVRGLLRHRRPALPLHQ